MPKPGYVNFTVKEVRKMNRIEDFKEVLSDPVFLSVILITIGGIIFYTIQGLISSVTGTSTTFASQRSLSTPLTAGPIAGSIAGLGYSLFGSPAILLLEKIKRFQGWKNRRLKTIVECETAIATAMLILVTMGIIYLIVYYPHRLPTFLHYLPQQFLESSPLFSIPLIGVAVVEVFKKARRVTNRLFFRG